MIYISLILLGVMTGFLSGLLGIGGGIILVPVFYLTFTGYGLSPAEVMPLAIGTSLAVMIFSSVSSFLGHFKHKTILWDILKKSIVGVFVGLVAGPLTAHFINSRILVIIFGAYLLYTAFKILKELIKENKNETEKIKFNKDISTTQLNIFGFVLGFISTLLGIGGGSISIPYFLHKTIKPKLITGTTSAYTVIVSVFGTIGYLFTGMSIDYNMPYTLGHIYLPVLIFMMPTTLIFARVGARVATVIPDNILKIFLIFLILTAGIKMLFS